MHTRGEGGAKKAKNLHTYYVHSPLRSNSVRFTVTRGEVNTLLFQSYYLLANGGYQTGYFSVIGSSWFLILTSINTRLTLISVHGIYVKVVRERAFTAEGKSTAAVPAPEKELLVCVFLSRNREDASNQII